MGDAVGSLGRKRGEGIDRFGRESAEDGENPD